MQTDSHRKTFLTVFLSLALIGESQSVFAENWPQWRGPFFNGSTTENHLPDHWSTTENVLWVSPLPGKSGATPAIWKDSVFVTSPDSDMNLLLLCLNAKNGKVKWQNTITQGNREVAKNNLTGPSPVTDGKRVIAIYATGDLVAFDFAGRELWRRNLAKEYGRFAIMFYYSSSPLLYHGKLYIQAVQRNPPGAYTHAIDNIPVRDSYLLCVDPQTGTNFWRQIRQTDATGESMDAYTSPTVYEGAQGPEIIVYGGGFVTSHRADTGAEIWRCGSLNPNKTGYWRTITSPVVGAGFVYACVPRNKSPLVAIKTGGTGLVPDSQIAWKFVGHSSDVPTPAFYRNKLFVLDGTKHILTCLDPQTGVQKWQGDLGVAEIFSASPVVGDGKIYCISEAGSVVIASAGDEFKIISSFKMEGVGATPAVAKNGIPIPSATAGDSPVLSSLAISGGHIFARGPLNLYCIGRK
jgi:outer membrane protein assembly factor BamB